MNRIRRPPSPALAIACVALFVALGGAAYAAATIGSEDIVNGSIRNRDFKDGTLRGQEASGTGSAEAPSRKRRSTSPSSTRTTSAR
jgi:hypothetical protein